MNLSTQTHRVETTLGHQLATLGPFPCRGTSEPQTQLNIGWTLGNACPNQCKHCYSAMVRRADQDLLVGDVERIVGQLVLNNVATVNLGGNEPVFTSGPDISRTLLPYIIRRLTESGIKVGITTSAISLLYMDTHYPEECQMINDVDLSLDSPFVDEHNNNRGGKLYGQVLKALEVCRSRDIPRSIIMCGMNWNLSERHLEALVALAKREEAFVRINFMKPTEPDHLSMVPDVEQFYFAMKYLFQHCDIVELGEPIGSAMSGGASRGCPCGTASLRIHSKTAEGKIPVSPCVYAHAFKGASDLLTQELRDITRSPEFEAYRQRRRDPSSIAECSGCSVIEQCRGGCASRAYLWRYLEGGLEAFRDIRDPYCLRDFGESGMSNAPQDARHDGTLVHSDYLCTIICSPK